MTRHDLLEFAAGGAAFYYAQRLYWQVTAWRRLPLVVRILVQCVHGMAIGLLLVVTTSSGLRTSTAVPCTVIRRETRCAT